MKALNVVAAFLGGIALGAVRKKGIRLSREEMDDLADQIASEVKDAD